MDIARTVMKCGDGQIVRMYDNHEFLSMTLFEE